MILTLKAKKWCVVGMLALFLSFETAALAQPTSVLAVTGSPDVVLEMQKNRAEDKIKISSGVMLQASIYQAILNAFMFFMQRIAYDTATWVASGGSGQGALVFKKGWGSYLEDAAKGAAGEAIGSLSQSLNDSGLITGFNLCAPSLSMVLKIQFGIAAAFQRPEPRCSWNQISNNWSSFVGTMDSPAIFNNIGVMFEPGQSGLSTAFETNVKILGISDAKKQEALNKRLEGVGFKPKEGILTGNVDTPALMVSSELNRKIGYGGELTSAEVTGAFFNTNVGGAIVRTVTSTFVNTLASKLLGRLTKGFFSIGDLFADEDSVFNPEFASVGGSQAARQVYSDLLTANINTLEIYDVLGDFAVCPQNRGPNNCVLDDQFATAIREASAGRPMTVREAITQGFIHEDWVLISDTARNQDRLCYTYGYCYSNLQKLRLARILPIGWEIAAQNSNNTTLGEAIAGFNDCNEDGDWDTDHPFCHLIDDNWVLKYPLTKCKALVPSSTLIDPGTDTRAQTCVDAPSCLAEDGQGNCTGGFGYCTREKNTWRFDGDECPAEFNTCQSFNSAGPESTHLALRTNTVDYGVCNTDNAGCLWYSTNQNYIDSAGDRICVGGSNAGATCSADANCPNGVCLLDDSRFVSTLSPDTVVWRGSKLCASGNDNGAVCTKDADCSGAVDANPTAEGDICKPLEASPPAVYLNRKAEVCDASSAGCSSFIPKRRGVTLNLVRNSSFEEDRDGLTGPDFWAGSVSEYGTNGSNSSSGTDAVRLPVATDILSQRIAIEPNRFYTLSVYAKNNAGVSASAYASARMFTETDTDAAIGSYFSTCEKHGGNRYRISSFASPDNYARFSCTFTSPANASYTIVSIYGSGGGTTWFDAVQLEENEVATAYADGYSGEGASDRVTLKKPPAGLCTGDATDPPVCANYAYVCAPTEVGCELYTPASGDPSIPGIARASDQCPSTCAGYQTFREEPTHFNPDGEYPAYFIPSTARACSAASAGCDEFTNVDNETREYYTYLRLCEEKAIAIATTATFYSWEGTAGTGPVLRTWELKKSNLSLTGVTATDTNGGIAPCTNYSAPGSAGGTGACDDDGSSNDSNFHPPVECDNRDDIFTNQDCREFFDIDGNIHYRLYSKTITHADSCADLRKTTTTQSDCNGSGGRWDPATNQCFYSSYVPWSAACSASVNGCRLYTGNAGRNVQTMMTEDFESGSLNGWDNGVISNESLAATGHSLEKYGSPATVAGYIDNPSDMDGRTLFVSFWAKGTQNSQLAVKFGSSSASGDQFSYNDTDPATPTVTLNTDWRFYELGPVTIDWASFGNSSGTIATCTDSDGCNYPTTGVRKCTVANGETTCNYDSFELITSGASDQLFFDNLIVKAQADNIALINNSWKTPAECDATPEGAYSAQAMLGCDLYRDRAGNNLYLKSFSSLCREKAIGCEAFFDTHNSDSPYAKTNNFICVRPDQARGVCSIDSDGTGPAPPREVCTVGPGLDRCTFSWDGELPDSNTGDTSFPLGGGQFIYLPYINGTEGGSTLPVFYDRDLTLTPADSTIYLVDSDTARCESDNVGCTAVGQPKFNQSLSTVESFDDQFRKILPDTFDTTLCTKEALFCDAWRTPKGSEYYFKNPLDKQCEYRTSGTPYGWFKKGTDEPCYDNFLISSQQYGIWDNRSVCTLAGTAGGPCPDGATGSSIQCIVRAGESSCSPFDGWAGSCEDQYSGCTEFKDAVDVGYDQEANIIRLPLGTPYDYINNDKLDEAGLPTDQQCGGLVSLKEGCVLLNDTSDAILRWNAGATYLKSARNNNIKVNPIDCRNPGSDAQYCKRCDFSDLANQSPPIIVNPRYCTSNSNCSFEGTDYPCSSITGQVQPNDSNLVLKVRRDRECAEWLACDESLPQFDPRSSKEVVSCSHLSLCDTPPAVKDTASCGSGYKDPTKKRLTASRYSNRDLSWYGKEYSGFSPPDLFPVATYEAVNVGACVPDSGDNTGPETTLVIPEQYEPAPKYPVETCNEENASVADDCDDSPESERCVEHWRLGVVFGSCTEPQNTACEIRHCSVTESKLCGIDLDCPSGEECNGDLASIDARCFSGKCAVSIGGSEKVGETKISPSCRVYPEINSPFPDDVIEPGGAPAAGTEMSVKYGFQNANICENGDSCECTYEKLSYQSGITKYRSEGKTDPSNICDAGPNKGLFCANDDGCDSDTTDDFPPEGRCVPLERADRFIGLPGFCLERDLSTPINGDGNGSQFSCLSWYPVDQIAGAASIYNQFPTAEFSASAGDEWYCAEGLEPVAGTTLTGPMLRLENPNEDESPAYLTDYFGSPSHDGCLDPTTESCITDHRHTDNLECQDADPGKWCLWPQKECQPDWEVNTKIRGSIYCKEKHVLLEQSGPNNNRGNNTNPGPEAGLNFLGCYEIADEGSGGQIHYPWTGPDIYQRQVEAFEVAFKDSDTECEDYTGQDNDSEFGGQRIPFKPVMENPNPLVENSESHLINMDGPDLWMWPIWDQDKKLAAIGVAANDDDDSLSFLISEFTIHFWPSCFTVAKAGEVGAAAYTDRVMIGNLPAGVDLNPPASGPETLCEKWGAICDFDGESDPLAVNVTGVPAGETGTTDALYLPAQLKQLFARSNDVWNFTDKTSTGGVCRGGGFDGATCSGSSDCSYSGDCEPVGVLDLNNQWVFTNRCVGTNIPLSVYNQDPPCTDAGDCTYNGVCDTATFLSLNADFIYEQVVSPTSSLKWDNTETADDGPQNAPEIHPLGACSGGACAERSEWGVTVNNQYFGDVPGAGGLLRVNLEFFANATKNRMPLREIRIDWGNQDQTILPGTYKNFRGSGECDGTDFGSTPESCLGRPFKIMKDYECNAAILATLPNCDATGRPVRTTYSEVGGCVDNQRCVYVPRVSALDNWGWCASDTPDNDWGKGCPGGPGGLGCYKGAANTFLPPDEQVDECNPEYPNSLSPGVTDTRDPWVYFDGRIVIEP